MSEDNVERIIKKMQTKLCASDATNNKASKEITEREHQYHHKNNEYVSQKCSICIKVQNIYNQTSSEETQT